MSNEHANRYKYPIKTIDFSIFGHAAQIRLFREEERDNYFFTVAFPNIEDEDNDGFVLEEEGDVYTLEAEPDIESKANIEIMWNIEGESLHCDPLVNISIKIKGTPVNSTSTFWRSAFPEFII